LWVGEMPQLNASRIHLQVSKGVFDIFAPFA
jgi:hypothetical protein